MSLLYLNATLPLAHFVHRQRMLEILNSNQYTPPIIVFVNQKKTADMVAKDLQRAGVCTLTIIAAFSCLCCGIFSGVQPLCTRARTKNNERLRFSHCVPAIRTSWSPPTLPVVVLMSRTLVW